MRKTSGPGGFMVDTEKRKAENAAAPKVENLLGRIAELFTNHRGALIGTIVLVLLGAGLSVIPPLLIERTFNEGLFPPVGPPNMTVLAQLVSLMVIIFIAAAAIGVWQTYLTARVGNEVMGQLRERLFSHLQSMELAFFTMTKTGTIQSRLQNDVGGVANVLSNTVSSVLGNTVTVIAAFVAMLLLSWQLTLVAAVIMPLMVIAQRRVGQVRAKIAGKTQESLSEMTAITQESLGVSGILLAKSFGRQQIEVDRYSAENKVQIGLQVRQTMSGQWFFAMVQIFFSAIPAIIYLVAGWLITEGSVVSIGTVVAFTTVQARLLFPLIGLMRVVLDLQTSEALFARIFEYIDLTPAINDPANPEKLNPENLGSVELRDVTFSYPGSDNEAATLKSVNIKVQKGQYAALVGPSGSGKTTISYLIPRLYAASEGQVLFAGVDVRLLAQTDLIDQVGIVNQETYLFHATIRENLAYAKPDATIEEIITAAKAANIHETISSFPEGYETVVGERGYRLSGGEKQRIAIARVLLKDPPVLILDEATSSMDTQSERIVQETLDAVTRNRTTIAIAHRLSTVINADVIFVISGGEVVERGTHTELLKNEGLYSKLVNEQFKNA
ncbi:MAG: ABC transporter ATP-binding protein [Aquiluna sp.]|nr:ABC transporter ATP-binding protein [Aquiluna sp.]